MIKTLLRALGFLLRSEWGAFGPKEPRRGTRMLEDYVSAALTAGTNKKEWVIDAPCELLGIRIDSGGAGAGAGSSTIDINKNGVTIFTTQANRPTIATASTGDYTTGYPDGITQLRAGDIIAYDVDAIPATTGHTRTKIAIALRYL